MNPNADTLEAFVARLMEEKGLTNLEPDIKKEVEQDLLDRVEDRINASIVANMPADKIAEFDALLDAGDENAIQSFTQAAIPGLDQIVAAELMSFRETYVNR